MEKPDISVIVPVYNVEAFLPQCIESILNQSYSNFKLILIDDGSSDNSGKICDQYANQDDRIIVYHKKNKGVSAARNFGIDKSSGKYICFIDSDDFVDKSYLEVLLNNSDKETLPVCGLRYVNSNKVFSPISNKIDLCVNPDALEQNMITLYFFGPFCKLFIRDILLHQNIRFDESMKLSEDIHFVLRYILHIKYIHFLSNALYYYNEPIIQRKYKSTSNEYYYNSNNLNTAIGQLEETVSYNFQHFRNWIDINEISHFYSYLLAAPKYKAFEDEITNAKKLGFPFLYNSKKTKLFTTLIKKSPALSYLFIKFYFRKR